MTAARFSARIEGREIHCRITVAEDLVAPVFCFSLLAPPAVQSGGQLLSHTGGYGEVQLPDLQADRSHEVVLTYADLRERPVNRAWLPLGAYLRWAGGVVPLPALPAGVRPATFPENPPSDALCLVPPPRSWQPTGERLDVRSFQAIDPLLQGVVGLAARLDIAPFLETEGIPLRLVVDAGLPPEGYVLQIAPDGVLLTHADAAGAHYGAISLLMLRLIHAGQIPCGRIEDHPRFAYRGQHLDCARHFFAPGTLMRLLDLMALFKLNRFHWHFADDEAFRLESDAFPDLARDTAFRGENTLIPGVFGAGTRAGGWYTRADARALVARAKQLCIEVLPEIEVPAHALCLTRLFPETRDPDDRGTEVSVQGYAGNTLNPAMPRTWEILERLTLDVAELFPIGMLHLGCDELPEGTWAGSPAVDGLKAREGLSSRDDVQGWMMARLARHLRQSGIRPAAWEEAARGGQGGIGADALLFSWTGQGPGLEAARRGHDVIMCPAQNVYLDMARTDDPQDWGAAWAAFVSLEDTVDWTVVPDPALAERIKGVEGAFWSEFTTEDRQIEPMIAPRILGVATKAWSEENALRPAALRRIAMRHGPVFAALDWQWAP